MKRTLALTADLAALALAVPAALTVAVCSWRSGGTGVGRHSPAFGCLAAAVPDRPGASVDLTVTAAEAALLVAFCGLQAARLLATAIRLLTSPVIRLSLLCLATGMLLLSAGSVAVNNPSSCLYSIAFVLELLAIAAQLTGFGLAVAVLVEVSQKAVTSSVSELPMPLVEAGIPSLRAQGQSLGFADEDLVHYERVQDQLLLRIGHDRGCVSLSEALASSSTLAEAAVEKSLEPQLSAVRPHR